MKIIRRKPTDSRIERSIITGMITSKQFLTEIQSIYSPQCMMTSATRIIAQWCNEYYQKYSEPPGKAIEDIFRERKDVDLDSGTIDEIELFLSSISDEYETGDKFNSKYTLDKAEKYFRLSALENLRMGLTQTIVGNRVEDGEELISNFRRVTKIETVGVDPFFDTSKIIEALDDDSGDQLFKLYGKLGEMIGELERGFLMGIVGAPAAGKCLHKDSQILLSDGRLKSLKWVVKNKEKSSVSMNKNLKIVKSSISEFYANGIKPIVEITTKTGRKIKITTNHPLYDFDKGWISVDDGLNTGNYIAVPKNINVFGNKKMPNEHVRLIAYLLADGGFTGSEITYTKKEQGAKDDVIKIITKLGDSYRIDNELTISINKGKRCYLPGKPKTKKLLLNYGIKLCKSIHKTIPDCIFTLPKHQLKEFLKTLFTGDGTVYDFGVEYSSGSEKMIRQVAHLLLRFGIIGKIRSRKMKGFSHTYWDFSIYDSFYVQKFIEKIGFDFSKRKKADIILEKAKSKKNGGMFDSFPPSYRKIITEKLIKTKNKKRFRTIIKASRSNNKITRNSLLEINQTLKDKDIKRLLDIDIIFDEIISIKRIGKEETYDLTVPYYHNFIADDICAHNSWFLIIIALRALFAGYKVLFLSLEMSEKQIIRRIMHWMTGLPIKKYAGKLLVPVFDCLWNQTNECKEKCDIRIINSQGDTKLKFHEAENYKPCTKCRGTSEYEAATWFEQVERKPLDIVEALKKRKILSRMSIIRSNRFKVAQFPSGELTMTQLKTYIHNLEYYNGFIPDVIITDYADKFKAEKYREYRHGLNEIWEGHKSLAQEKNCLVVTASQTNTARTGKDIVQGSWAEDIRKLNLIDVGFAINQTPKEKLQGYYRCGVLKQRHEDFNLLGEVCVLNCLKIGRPYLDSEKVNWEKDEVK